MSKKWWQFWKEQKNANTLDVLIRQSGNFTSYNFAQFLQEAYRQNPTVYACIQQYISAFNACPFIIYADICSHFFNRHTIRAQGDNLSACFFGWLVQWF